MHPKLQEVSTGFEMEKDILKMGLEKDKFTSKSLGNIRDTQSMRITHPKGFMRSETAIDMT